MATVEQHRNAVCTECGLLCDDIAVRVERDRVVEVDTHGCGPGREFFLGARAAAAPLIEGRPASVDQALDRAADVLTGGRHPLVLGLSGASSEAQRVAVAIADLLGASIDAPGPATFGAQTLARQMVGEVTGTLGEATARADLVVCWRVDPMRSHPRLLARILDASGRFVPGGRAARTLVVVDDRRTPTTALADWFVSLGRDEEFEALSVLRTHLREAIGAPPGPAGDLSRLADRLRSARHPVVVYGPASPDVPARHHTLAQLFGLVQDLHRHTRALGIALSGPLGHGNAAGVQNVLAWQTGYPAAVNLSRGFPRGNPGEFTMEDLLRRGEVDRLLQVGEMPPGVLGDEAARVYARIPRVSIGRDRAALVSIPTGVVGIESAGTVYRMDGVALRARQLVTPTAPSDVDVLGGLLTRVRSRVGAVAPSPA